MRYLWIDWRQTSSYSDDAGVRHPRGQGATTSQRNWFLADTMSSPWRQSLASNQLRNGQKSYELCYSTTSYAKQHTFYAEPPIARAGGHEFRHLLRFILDCRAATGDRRLPPICFNRPRTTAPFDNNICTRKVRAHPPRLFLTCT